MLIRNVKFREKIAKMISFMNCSLPERRPLERGASQASFLVSMVTDDQHQSQVMGTDDEEHGSC